MPGLEKVTTPKSSERKHVSRGLAIVVAVAWPPPSKLWIALVLPFEQSFHDTACSGTLIQSPLTNTDTFTNATNADKMKVKLGQAF